MKDSTCNECEFIVDRLLPPGALRGLVDANPALREKDVVLFDPQRGSPPRMKDLENLSLPVIWLNGHRRHPVDVCIANGVLGIAWGYISRDSGSAKLTTLGNGISVEIRGGDFSLRLPRSAKKGDVLFIAMSGEKSDYFSCSTNCTFGGKGWSGTVSARKADRTLDYDIRSSGDRITCPLHDDVDTWKIMWLRPGRAKRGKAEYILELSVDGWFHFNRIDRVWINDLSGKNIHGRQDLPPIHPWIGWAFLPARVTDSDDWDVRLV